MELTPEDLVDIAPAPPLSRLRRAVRVLVIAATLGYLVWLVARNWTDLDRAVLRIGNASWRWFVIAVLVETASQIAGGLLMHRLLTGAGHPLSIGAAVRLVMAQNAIGMVAPGGPVAGNTFAFRHLRQSGLDAASIAWVLTGTTTVTVLAVVVLGVVAQSGADTSSVMAIAALGLVIVGLMLVVRRPHLVRRPLRMALRLIRSRRRVTSEAIEHEVDRVVVRLGAVRLSSRDWLYVALFGLVAAAADCVAFACCTRAVIRLPARCAAAVVPARVARQCKRFRAPTLSRILLAYVAGQAASSIPLVPGGVGPVEAAMTATFVAGGIRAVPALSAVVLYRLISYWGVVLVGLLCWWWLRRNRTTRGRAVAG